MDTKVSPQTRKEVLQSLRVRYHQANKAGIQQMALSSR
jgi:hypothetical protein